MPELDHDTTLPAESVMVTMALLKSIEYEQLRWKYSSFLFDTGL
jgi:hypothetical protein